MKHITIKEWHSGKQVFRENDDIHGTGRNLAREFLKDYYRVPNDAQGVIRNASGHALKAYHGASLMNVTKLRYFGFIR
jgi:hypothetical protein